MTDELISKLTNFTLCSGLSEELTAGLKDIIEILKSGKRLWAARDADGDLYLYTRLPERTSRDVWEDVESNGSDYYDLPADLLPSLTWEDEPKLVTLGIFIVDD